MGLSLDIAVTHLKSRKRQTAVSVLGVAMGVGFSVAMAALMQGFQEDFVSKVIENTPHIVMKDEFRKSPIQPVRLAYPNGAIKLRGLKPKDEIRGIKRARRILSILADWPGIVATPTLQGQIFLRYGSKNVAATVIGIDPDRERRVTNIAKDIKQGSLDRLKTASNGIIIGSRLAEKLGVSLNAPVTVSSPKGVLLKMKIVGLFTTGVVQLDESQSYALLKKVQILEKRINIINGIRIRTVALKQSRAIAAKIERRFGYKTESWQEANEGVFGVFVIQNAIMYSTTGAILIVACFGIFNIISTVIYEKTRDIAILKSIGFQQSDIKRIFLLEGLAVGAMGAVIGCCLGLGLTVLLGSVELNATEGAIEINRFIMKWSVWHYAASSGIAMTAAVLAAYLPARKAAQVNPVSIIRGAA